MTELTKICCPKPFDSIHVGENCMNKVEEGAPAKVTQRKRFLYSCSIKESERGKDFLRFKS